MIAMRMPINSLQKYAYTTLNTGGNVVYNFVPANAVYPYFKIGEVEVEDWSSKVHYGGTVNLHVTCWSSTQGSKELNEMVNTVVESLVNSRSVLDDGFKLINTEFGSVATRDVPVDDGIVQVAEIILRCYVQQTS